MRQKFLIAFPFRHPAPCLVLLAFFGAMLARGCSPTQQEDMKKDWDRNLERMKAMGWNHPAQPAFDAWPVNEMEKLTARTPRRQDDLLVNSNSGAIDLFAASNETVSFQVVVQAEAEGLQNVKVACTELQAGKKKIAAESFRLYRLLPMRIADYPAWYLRLTETTAQPEEFYDAMVPLPSPGAAQPAAGLFNRPAAPPSLAVEANQRLVLWVDLYVPRGTAADEYAGEIAVLADGRPSWSMKLHVQVYDMVLPDARAIAAVGGFDHDALLGRLIQSNGKAAVPSFLDRRDPAVRRGLAVIRQIMQEGHDHRLDLFDTRLRPLLKRDDSGGARLDWSDYDAIAQPYLDGSAFADHIGTPAWPAPFCQDWPNPADYGGSESPVYAQTAKSVIALSRDHFADEDLGKRVFVWPSRGKSGQAGYDEFARLARMVRSVDGRTPILCEQPLYPPPSAGWRVPEDFRGLFDILAPPGHWFDPRSLAARPDPNGPPVGEWLAPGYPPHFPPLGVLATPADVRAIPWLAMKYGCSGLLIDDVLNWSGDPFGGANPRGRSAEAGALQTTLFYPGSAAGIEGVLPSVRLKWLRRGLEDIAYLMVLRQRGRADLARQLMDSMVRYAGADADADQYLDARLDGWVKDPQVWATAQRILAQETLQVVNPAELSGRELLAERLSWQDLRMRTATVQIEQVRTKLSVVSDADGRDRLLATLLLDLYNEYEQPVAPTIRVGALPRGWESLDGGQVALEPMAPNSRRTVLISLRGLAMPFSAVAKFVIPLTFEFPDGRQKRVDAVVPALQAATVAKPPRIDGLLDDWPLRKDNSAGDFTLLGRRGRAEGGLARRQTRVAVLSDAENLYISFRCQEPNLSELATRTDNFVRYEQLMACGEDLVEILLDPGAKAKGPEDLYHIIVKPSGIVIAERGVGTDLPLGKSAAWASGARVAVSRHDQEWIVEMALPLSAFGADRSQPFWGVNFARFAPSGQESSNWAQASRYLYHPRNLGTMYLPAPPPLTAPATKESSNGK
jgi:hypothetical protein